MPKRPPNQEQFVNFFFPVKGVDMSQAYGRQPQDTTPTGNNVRAYDPITARARGGQRPGLAKYISGVVGLGGVIQELNTIVGVGYAAPGPTGVQGAVQASAGVTGGTGSQSDTFGQPTTPGNAIIVVVGVANGESPSAVTDAAGNSYSKLGEESLSSADLSVWEATSTSSVSGYSVTINSGYSGVSLLGFEIVAPGTLDKLQGTGGVANSGSSVAITTTNANEFAICAAQVLSPPYTVAGGPGASWALPGSQIAGGQFLCGYQNLYSIATGLQGSFTFTHDPDYVIVIASFVVG